MARPGGGPHPVGWGQSCVQLPVWPSQAGICLLYFFTGQRKSARVPLWERAKQTLAVTGLSVLPPCRSPRCWLKEITASHQIFPSRASGEPPPSPLVDFPCRIRVADSGEGWNRLLFGWWWFGLGFFLTDFL